MSQPLSGGVTSQPFETSLDLWAEQSNLGEDSCECGSGKSWARCDCGSEEIWPEAEVVLDSWVRWD